MLEIPAGPGRVRGDDVDIAPSALEGALRHLRSIPRDLLAARRSGEDVVEGLLRQASLRARGSERPDPTLLNGLYAWATYLYDNERLPEAIKAVDAATRAGSRFLPEAHGRFLLLRADLAFAEGDHDRAYSLLSGLLHRRDLVADRHALAKAMSLLGRAALLTHRVDVFRETLFEGLGAFAPDISERREMASLLARSYGGGVRLLLSDATPTDKRTYLAHALFFRVHRFLGPLRRPGERAFLAAAYANQYAHRSVERRRRRGPAAVRQPQGVLVSRAMGGIGDLLMMTPGLRALRRETGEPVHLALPRWYFPLFEGNDDVRLVDIHGDVDARAFARWHNLTDCPAARAESLRAPRIRRNRIELFARGLGIRGAGLRAMDRKPRYEVSEEESRTAAIFFEERALRRRPVVAVQLRSDEPYRDFPEMRALVQALARSFSVVVFSEHPTSGYDHDNVVRVERHGLREAFAIAAACDVIVAPDSAFFHLAGALDIPSIGLFGPTDGHVRRVDYPRATTLDARRDLRCVPCWRNATIPCALTGGSESVCLGVIAIQTIIAAAERAVSRAGARRG